MEFRWSRRLRLYVFFRLENVLTFCFVFVWRSYSRKVSLGFLIFIMVMFFLISCIVVYFKCIDFYKKFKEFGYRFVCKYL